MKNKIYEEFQEACAILEEPQLHIWISKNWKKLQKAGIKIHFSHIDLGRKLEAKLKIHA